MFNQFHLSFLQRRRRRVYCKIEKGENDGGFMAKLKKVKTTATAMEWIEGVTETTIASVDGGKALGRTERLQRASCDEKKSSVVAWKKNNDVLV
ncbi:hypothetical protein QL285_000369 [Trifolium repens]|nr:hypothetical protein QL285_000369 [Trifolium repens]